MVSSSRKVSYDDQDRKRLMIFEVVMCFLLPLVFMALRMFPASKVRYSSCKCILVDYIVQGHRFDIFEDIGCQAAIYISIEAVFIIWIPQLLFFTFTFIFGALALHNFCRRRLTFDLHLHQSDSALTTDRYLRLIAMALTEMILGTSLTAINLFSNISVGLRPWISWENVHSNFSRVGLFPTSILAPQFITNMMIVWWAPPASSIIFFAFFGFEEEALKEYKKVWAWIRVKVFDRHMSCEKGKSFFGSPFLRSFKSTTSSSSPDFSKKSISSLTSVSHQSHFPELTIKLASPLSKSSFFDRPITRIPQSKDEEAAITCSQSSSQGPPYPCSYPGVYLAHPEYPASDNVDTFSISTSYYGGAPSPSSASHRFELAHPYPSLVEQPQGLSPPPVFPIIKRPIPRDMPSSADSVMMARVDSLSPSSSPDLVSTTVPQDATELSLLGRVSW